MSFKRIAAVFGIALLAVGAAYAGGVGAADFRAGDGVWLYNNKAFFSTSSHTIHHTFRKDRARAIEDLKGLKAAGFTTVEVYWMRDQDSRPDGTFSFADFDDFVLECKKLGLRNFCMLAADAPVELARKYGWGHLSEEGSLLYRPEDFCMFDPSYVTEAKRFDLALLDHLKSRPEVSENILYWNVGGEISPFRAFRQARPLDYGYEDLTVQAFRKWLASRGHTLKSLAGRWGKSGTAYESWGDVWPAVSLKETDFKGAALSHIGAARWDWYEFRQEASWRFVQDRIKWIRKAGDNRPLVYEYNVIVPGGIVPFLRWGRVSARQDGDGVHMASGSFDQEFEYAGHLYNLAVCKGASAPPWQSNELKGNASPEWMRKHTWLFVAWGGTGMVFWDWASSDWGLLGADRSRTESYPEAVRLNSQFQFYGDLLQSSRPMPNRIGILALAEETFYKPQAHSGEINTILKALLDQGSGCEVSVITDDEILTDEISGYRLILVPGQEHMRQSVREKLAAFVARGGSLWLTSGCASKSETDQETPSNPGAPLDKVAGVSVGGQIAPVAAPLAGGVEGPLGTLSRSVTARTATSVRQIGGRPAIFKNKYGKGTCYYQAAAVAYPPGKDTPIMNDPAALAQYIASSPGQLPADCLSEALNGAGVEPYADVFDGGGRALSSVLVGVRKTRTGYLLFLVEAGNYTSDVTVRLNARRFGLKGSWAVYAPETLEQAAVKDSRFSTRLEPAQVKIFHLLPASGLSKCLEEFKQRDWAGIAGKLPPVRATKLLPPSEMGRVDPGDLSGIKPQPFGDKWLLVDISRHANKSLLEEGKKENAKSFIGSGGVGDNDLRTLPTGTQEFLGVPYRILDPKTNERCCMVTKTSGNPGLGPMEFKGIPVRGTVQRIHWLYGAGWALPEMPVGYITYNYADGGKCQENVICGRNIANWWGRARNYESDKFQLAWSGITPAAARNNATVGLYHYAWENPSPGRNVESIDVTTYGGDACIFVVAITAER